MEDESTVLVVKTDQLPSGLVAQLEKKNVFIEEAALDHLPPALVAIAPDLLVIVGSSDVKAALSLVDSREVPVAVIADRAEHRTLRGEHGNKIAALIPKELPAAALAHRLVTLSRRAARGEQLQQMLSLAPGAAPPATRVKERAQAKLEAKVPLQDKPRGPAVARPSHPKGSRVARGGTELEGARAQALEHRTASPARRQERPPEGASPLLGNRPLAQAGPPRAAEAARTDTATRKNEAARMEKPEGALGRGEAPVPDLARAVRSVETEPTDDMDSIKTASFELAPEARQKGRGVDSGPPPVTRRERTSDELIALSRPPPDRNREPERAATPPAPWSERGPSSGRPSESRPSQDELLAAPTPDAARRMADADALARRIRQSTVAISSVRVVVCDDDVTRLDSITSELREHGLDVMVLSPEYRQVRWQILRRYAPHGLLVDERSLSKGGREIVGTFRRDPFLKYVPLVAIRFDRLYREDEARVNLAPLFPLLQPLGREELTLLDRLTISRQLTVDLSQVLPNRLVELLGEHDQTCVLDCASAGQRLTWPLSVGRAGKAELLDRPGSAGISLKAEDAIRWLLAQDEPLVTVSLRPQIRLTHDEPIGALLDRVSASIEPPPEHSIAPPRGSRAPMAHSHTLLGVAPAPNGASQAEAGLPTIPAPTQGARGQAERLTPPPGLPREARMGGVPGVGQESLRLTPAPATGIGSEAMHGTRMPGALPIWSRALAEGTRLVERSTARTKQFVREQKAQQPPWRFWSLAAATGVALLVSSLLLVRTCTSQADVAEPQALGEDSSPGQGTDAGERSTSRQGVRSADQGRAEPSTRPGVGAALGPLDRFRVAPDSQATDCRELVGEEATQRPLSQAAGYWKAARTKLMQGDVEQAHEMMCRAALIDPGGPAAEGLAGFYLGRRSLDNAESWVKRVLAANPESRSGQELLSDIRNQQGRPDDALSILLGTMNLATSDVIKREIVSRKFRADAALAVRSGDLPRAERLLRRSVVLDPKNEDAVIDLVDIFLRLELPAAAQAWGQHLLSLDASSPVAHLILGDVARLGRDYATAREHYAKVTAGSRGAARAEGYLQDMPR